MRPRVGLRPWEVLRLQASQSQRIFAWSQLVPITFYDRTGVAAAYSDDDVHVFLFGGQSVAYLDSDALYSYSGELMGWFEEGWLRDKDGHCVAFSERATGGPSHSMPTSRPHKSAKRAHPEQTRKDPRTLRPIHSNVWSTLAAGEFFARLRHR